MGRASLTAVGFCLVMCVCVVAFILEAVGQLHTTGRYVIPDTVIDSVRLALSFAFGTGAFAVIRERRKSVEKKTNRSRRALPAVRVEPESGDSHGPETIDVEIVKEDS